MASQEGHSEGLSTRDAAMVVPPESPPFRAGRFKQSIDVVTAVIDTRNGDSIGLVRRLGFRQESLTLDADFFKGHRSHEVTFTCRRHELVNPRSH